MVFAYVPLHLIGEYMNVTDMQISYNKINTLDTKETWMNEPRP